MSDYVYGIAALIVGVFLLAFWVPKRLKQQKLLDQHNRHHQIDESKRLRESTDGLMVEMADLGRQITGQIDTKITVLKTLIQQADESTERLVSMQKELAILQDEIKNSLPSQHPMQSDEVTHDVIEGDKEKSPLVSERHQKIYSLADEGLNAKEIAEKLDERHGEVELILGLRQRENKTL